MKSRSRTRRWLVALLPLLLTLALMFPFQVYSSGEVELKVSKEVVQVGEAVTFEAILPVSGIVVEWDFGDDSPKTTGPLVSHTYETAGEFTATMKATYPSGTESQLSVQIRVVMVTGNTPPQAKADVSPLQTLAGQLITFDATGSSDPDGEISRYLWNFGDGNSSTDPQTTHAYAQAGTYYTILTVTDNGEMDATDTVSVTVTALPTAIMPGISRVIPKPAGPPPDIYESIVLVDMGIWDGEKEHFPFREWQPQLQPPFRGAVISNRDWLDVEPTEFERIDGDAVVLRERISVRNTLLLPRAHTSWAMVTFVVNGRIVELPVLVTIRGPNDRDISADAWALYEEILDYLTDKGQRTAMAYSQRYSNGADFALGLITEYVLTDGYEGQMPQQDFVIKVAELLMDRDENGDGFVGFTDLDLGLGIKLSK